MCREEEEGRLPERITFGFLLLIGFSYHTPEDGEEAASSGRNNLD